MFLAKGKYDEAIKNFEAYFEKNRDSYEAAYLLGLTYYKKGMADKGLSVLEKSLKIKEDYIPALFLKGKIFKNKGRLKEAEAVFNYIVKKAPDYKDAAYILAQILYEIGDYSKSLVFIESAAGGEGENSEYLELKRKIIEKLSAGKNKKIIFEKARILLVIEHWRKSWELSDINSYLSFYSDSFKWKGGGIKEWRDFKKKIFAEKKPESIRIKDMDIFQSGDYIIVNFFQDYTGSLFKDSGFKELKLAVEGENLKIISESFKRETDEKK